MYTTSTTSLASESSNQIGRPISLMRFNRPRQSSTGLVILRQGGGKQLLPSLILICAPLTNRQQPNHTPKKIRLFDYLIFVFVFCLFLFFYHAVAWQRDEPGGSFFFFDFLLVQRRRKKQVAISVYLYRQTSVVFVWLLLAEPGRSLYPLHSVSHPADALVGSLIIKFRFSLSATVARERETNSPRFHYWHMSQRGDDLGVCVSTLEARTCLLLPPSCRSVSPRFGRTDGLD